MFDGVKMIYLQEMIQHPAICVFLILPKKNEGKYFCTKCAEGVQQIPVGKKTCVISCLEHDQNVRCWVVSMTERQDKYIKYLQSRVLISTSSWAVQLLVRFLESIRHLHCARVDLYKRFGSERRELVQFVLGVLY